MWNEFKAFVVRGHVVEMAVGVILGTAFGTIVTSLVGDILMPPIGLLLVVMFWLITPITRWKGVRAAAAAPAVTGCPDGFSQIPLKAVRCAQCTAAFTP